MSTFRVRIPHLLLFLGSYIVSVTICFDSFYLVALLSLLGSVGFVSLCPDGICSVSGFFTSNSSLLHLLDLATFLDMALFYF